MTPWTIPFARGSEASVESQKLIAAKGGSVWWLADLRSPHGFAVHLLVDRDGVVRLDPPAVRDYADALTARDGSLLLRSERGSFLEVWDPS